MTSRNASDDRITHATLSVLGATAIAVAIAISLAQPAHAGKSKPPPVPSGLQVDAGSRAFLVGHAVGTQNYSCLPSGLGFAWTLFTPQATLYRDDAKQVTTHFFSPNPIEGGTTRATWEHSRDTSTVWGQPVNQSSDAAYVAPGAIPWLLIQVVGAEEGPTGGDALTPATQIQRLNTVGGVAPSTGCSEATDVGKRAYAPYSADYYFYSKPNAASGAGN